MKYVLEIGDLAVGVGTALKFGEMILNSFWRIHNVRYQKTIGSITSILPHCSVLVTTVWYDGVIILCCI